MDCNVSRFPGFVSFIAERCYGCERAKPAIEVDNERVIAG